MFVALRAGACAARWCTPSTAASPLVLDLGNDNFLTDLIGARQRRHMTWQSQPDSVRTLPLEWGWRRSSKYDWDTLRSEVFEGMEDVYGQMDPSIEGNSKGDQRPREKRGFIPEPDGFPEVEEMHEDIQPAMRGYLEESHVMKKTGDPKPPSIPLPRVSADGQYIGFGKRKASSATVFLKPGEGLVTVNGRPLHLYFQQPRARELALQPLSVVQSIGEFNMRVEVTGGGTYGQAGAVSLALSRALMSFEPASRPALRLTGHAVRDPRQVERKKIGKKKARRAPQWSKR